MGRLVERWGAVVPGPVLDARAEAQAILEEARQQADALRAEGWTHGVDAGREHAAAACTEMLVAARRDAERVRAAALPSARVLALRIAEKIVGHAVDVDPATLTSIAQQAMDVARARSGVVTLRIHPDDEATLHRDRAALMARLARGVELRLVADPSVSRYGCIVDTPAGRVDARLEMQLAALARALGAVDDSAEGSAATAGAPVSRETEKPSRG